VELQAKVDTDTKEATEKQTRGDEVLPAPPQKAPFLGGGWKGGFTEKADAAARPQIAAECG